VTQKKNISISEETYERLKGYGEFGDTYDDVLKRLMDDADDLKKERDG
jgi:predicted CopG family antitoxin